MTAPFYCPKKYYSVMTFVMTFCPQAADKGKTQVRET